MSNPRLSLAIDKIRQAMQLNQEAGDILTAEALTQQTADLPAFERCPDCGGKYDSPLGFCACPL